MKKIKVIVKEREILELAEDASRGDVIDLKELVTVDQSYLEAVIEAGKDKLYASKLDALTKKLESDKEIEVNKLKAEIEKIKVQNEASLKENTSSVEKKYEELLASKDKELEVLKASNVAEIEKLKLENDTKLKLNNKEHEKEISDKLAEIKKENELLKAQKESAIEALKLQYNSDLLKELQKQKEEFEELLKEKEDKGSKELRDKEKKLNEAEVKYKELEGKYSLLEEQLNSKINQNKLELELSWKDKLAKAEADKTLLEQQKDAEIEGLKLTNANELSKALQEQKDKFNLELKNKEDMINDLQRAKARLNVKQTGEDLEEWCNNEVTQYMQNGLFNCTWSKDNAVVKEEGETKGSKADFLFKVYSSDKHEDSELLASVCLEMKDENPDSVNKKSNADYYEQLNKNRNKKQCKYAVLVSNLELDKPNSIPIYKVIGYEEMYVVRPAYLMVFLNMLTSLSTRFKDLVLSDNEQKLELKNKFDLIEQFEAIKLTYLDKPLITLENNINAILKSSDSIKKACKDIDDNCEKTTRNYIGEITKKLEKYELKLNKDIVKKV